MVSTQWRGDEILTRLYNSTAEGLLLCAETLRVNHQARLSRINPPPKYLEPSKEGEYPRQRTGAGKEGMQVVPATLSEAVRTLRVKTGFTKDTWYMIYLERYRRRLGLETTLKELRPLLARLVSQTLRKG